MSVIQLALRFQLSACTTLISRSGADEPGNEARRQLTTGLSRGARLSHERRVRVRKLTTGIRQYSHLSWFNFSTQELQPEVRAQRAGADCARHSSQSLDSEQHALCGVISVKIGV